MIPGNNTILFRRDEAIKSEPGIYKLRVDYRLSSDNSSNEWKYLKPKPNFRNPVEIELFGNYDYCSFDFLQDPTLRSTTASPSITITEICNQNSISGIKVKVFSINANNYYALSVNGIEEISRVDANKEYALPIPGLSSGSKVSVKLYEKSNPACGISQDKTLQCGCTLPTFQPVSYC